MGRLGCDCSYFQILPQSVRHRQVSNTGDQQDPEQAWLSGYCWLFMHFFSFTMCILIMPVSSKDVRNFGSAGSVFCNFVCIFPTPTMASVIMPVASNSDKALLPGHCLL
jgi:hypothetical protein